MAVRVHTLGEVGLVGADGEPIPLRRIPLAVLAYVARRTPRPVSRSELSTCFWGERSEGRARQSLRQAVLELKQAVGDAIEVTPESVRARDGEVLLDIVEFESDAKHARHEAAAERWRGDFFPHAEEVGDGFNRWVEAERVTLQRRFGVVMQHLIGAAELGANWRAASVAAERWASGAPFDERAHARVVETLRMDGRATEALERHAEFVARLRRSLDIEPSAEFLRLAGGLEEQVRLETVLHGRRSAAIRAPALVGRAHELAELAAARRVAAAGTPVVVLVECGGGRGKTRLCDELASSANAETIVLRARGDPAHPPSDPYATARDLLAGLRDAPGSAGASPEALAEVARIVPSLATAFKYLPPPVSDDATLQRALVQLLAAVSEESPVLMLLDDAHGSDDDTLRLLSAVAGRLTGRIVMVLFIDDGWRDPRSPLDAVLATPGVLRIRLHRLAEHDVDAMVASMLDLPDSDRRRLAARLHAETLGVPLLIREIVAELVGQGLVTLDTAGEWRVSPTLEGRPFPLPVTVRDRISTLLLRLTPAARSVVEAASVTGTPAEGLLLEAVAALPAGTASAAFRELIARHFLQDVPGTGRLDFTHPVLGSVAYALLAPSERQALHARAATEMTRRDMTTTAERSVLPYHIARAGLVGPEGDGREGSLAAGSTRRRVPRRRIAWVAGAVLLAAAVTAGATQIAGRRRGGSAGATEPWRVIVGAFQNPSGDPELDRVRDIAVDWIVRGLDETGLVEIVGMSADGGGGWSRVAAFATDQGLRDAARSARAGKVVTGTVHQVADSIEMEVIIVDASSGTLLQALPAIRMIAGNPIPGIKRLRGQVVGALAAMIDPMYDPGGAGTRSPPTYDAYVAFMRGEQAADRQQFALAVEEYARASAADSAYTLPLLRMAYSLYVLGRCDQVDSIGADLRRRRRQLSRFEGIYLERVDAWCRADWDAAHRAAAQVADLAPHSQLAQFSAARSALQSNRPHEALRRLQNIDPADGLVVAGDRYWTFLVIAQHMAGEAGELRRTNRRIATLAPTVFTVGAAAISAGALGRHDDLERAAAAMAPISAVSGYSHFLFMILGLDELRAHGGGAASRTLGGRWASEIGERARAGPAGDTARFMQAELLYRAERWNEAHAVVETVLPRLGGDRLVLGLRGRTAARMGDTAEARRASDQLARLTGRSLEGAHIYARAQIAAALGDRDEAVRLLQDAVGEGLMFILNRDLSYLGHADVDLADVIDHPAIQTLLKPKG